MKSYRCLKYLFNCETVKYFSRSKNAVRLIRCYTSSSGVNPQQERDQHPFTNQAACVASEQSLALKRSKNDDLASSDALRLEQMQRALYLIEDGLRRHGSVDPRNLINYLDSLQPEDEMSPAVASMLIKCCGDRMPFYPTSKKVEILHRVLDTLKRRNFRFDISHYNSLLSTYLEIDYAFSPVEILARLKEEGIEPNRNTFERLIRKFALSGDLAGIQTAMERMKALDAPFTEYVYDSLLFAHIKANRDSELEAAIDSMVDKGFGLNADSYADMMRAYADNNDIENVEKILNERADVEFTDAHIFQVMGTFVKRNRIDYAMKMLERVPKRSGYIREASFSAMRMNAMGLYEEAVEILNGLPKSTSRPNQKSPEYGIPLLDQAVELDFKEEDVLNLCRLMQNKGVNDKATEIAFVFAVKAKKKGLTDCLMKRMEADPAVELRAQCFWPLLVMRAREGDWLGLQSIANHMRSLNFSIDRLPLHQLIWPYLASDGQSDDHLLTSMQTLAPDVSLYNAVTSLLLYRSQRADIESARNLVERYGAYIFVDPYVDSCLITYFGRSTIDADLVAQIYSVQYEYSSQKERTLLMTDIFLQRCAFELSHVHARQILEAFVERKVGASPNSVRRLRSAPPFFGSDARRMIERLVDNGVALSRGLELSRRRQAYGWESFADVSRMSPSQLTDYVRAAHSHTLNNHTYFLAKEKVIDDLIKLTDCIERNRRCLSFTIYFAVHRAMYSSDHLKLAVRFYLLAMKRLNSNFVPYPYQLLAFFNDLASAQLWDDLRNCAQTLGQIWIASSSPCGGDATTSLGESDISSLVDKLLRRLFEPFIDSKAEGDSTLAECQEHALRILQSIVAYKPFNVGLFHLDFILATLLDRNRITLAKGIFEILFENSGRVVRPAHLMRVLALNDDDEGLKRVYDTTARCLGDKGANINLAAALFSAGRLDDAEQIMSESNLNQGGAALLAEGEHFFRSKDRASLDALIRLTETASDDVRAALVLKLLLLYKNEKLPQPALDLSTRLREENFKLSPEALGLLDSIRDETQFDTFAEKAGSSSNAGSSAARSEGRRRLTVESNDSVQ